MHLGEAAEDEAAEDQEDGDSILIIDAILHFDFLLHFLYLYEFLWVYGLRLFLWHLARNITTTCNIPLLPSPFPPRPSITS